WINNSVESFVRDTFGDAVWTSVLTAAGVSDSGGWVSSCPYPDSETYKLVVTASNMLGVTPAQALEAYGVYFVDYVTKQGYGKLLHTLGSNIAEFLQSLNNLHLHLTMSFPAMSAPAFKCTGVGPESLELHYHSNRPALGPIVVGVLRGLAERYWGLGDRLGVKLLRGRDDGSEDHEVFLVTYPYQEALSHWQPAAPAAEGGPLPPSPLSPHRFTVCPDTFYSLFPFHLLLDRQCFVVQAGAALMRLFPDLTAGTHLADTFQLRHPYISLEYDTIISELNNAFLLKAKATGLEVKGQMLPVPLLPPHCSSSSGGGCGGGGGGGCPFAAAAAAAAAADGGAGEGLLFLGTVRLSGLDDMRDQRLFLSDIPLHDINRDFVLLAEQRQAEAQLKERFEALTLELKKVNSSLCDMTHWLEQERERSDQLLYQMLPRQVATVLKSGAKMPASEHPEATILFSDIVGFTEIAARCSPLEVCSLLDELYHHFDTAIEQYPELYKVETIGDAYMVVANVTTPCPNHADRLLEFAVRMHQEARQVRCTLGESVRIRVGMHSGPVVAGVVGKKMPRFCLFGDTVNTASRMESHGLPGQIHISDACYSCLKNKAAFAIRERGNISVKGKGMMRTYLIAPAEQAAC
ncbi:guanylyl and adenylyl cyclase family member, partial [Volvox carteri f. nagariensis]